MISNLVGNLPLYLQSSDWQRLYRMDQDGCSFITFLKNTREYPTTVLVVKDQAGWVFGALITEPWKLSHGFYGSGENILFSFEDQDDPLIYKWLGEGEQHQYASERALGLGGSDEGRFALYLANDFASGSSFRSEMFNNEPLSKTNDFQCAAVEVWAILE